MPDLFDFEDVDGDRAEDRSDIPGRAERVNLFVERDDETTSWRRAATTPAVWESLDDGPGWYRLAFVDGGGAHRTFVAGDPDDVALGWCDCDGWAHAHGSGEGWGRSPCAHVCRLHQEGSLDRVDVPALDESHDGRDAGVDDGGDRGRLATDGGERR